MGSSSATLVSFLLLFLAANVFFNGVEGRPGGSAILVAREEENAIEIGTRWAVLVAGSSGYGNYRHQADVCHAYQLLKKGGLKEENIVVFMYDDIAYNDLNPRRGVIINHPQGQDVYAGVPKDYTGKEVNTDNLFAVLLGDKSAIQGGSGKVIDSKAGDRIFVYYTDHGGAGILGMPNPTDYLYAADFIEVLKKKHASGNYKEMVIYVEACESGSIFEGILPEDLNIYVTTASNAEESSWGTYCPGMDPPPPPEFDTCLGDLFSIAWMEDSETHNLKKEKIRQQYMAVKERTSQNNTYDYGSHVMEYGNKSIRHERLYLYQGYVPENENITTENSRYAHMEAVNQRDADLLFFWHRYIQLEDGSEKKLEALKEITERLTHRMHLEKSVEFIGKLLFGAERGPSILIAKRSPGQALVDDWACLKSMVEVFETHCGPLGQYGMKHMRAFANICNGGVSKDLMEAACVSSCSSYVSGPWNPSSRGYGD